jgi:hypothetical protein
VYEQMTGRKRQITDLESIEQIMWRYAEMKHFVTQRVEYGLAALRNARGERRARQGRRPGSSGMLVLPLGKGAGEAGISKLALTLIITGVSVGLAIAVFAILGDKIMALARDIGVAIDSVDATGGGWGE